VSGVLVLCAAGLCATGVYLITARSLSRILLGFSLLGHGAVVSLVASGGLSGAPPLADRPDIADAVNPLPQALALTAIVISFGLTLFLLALARRQQQLTGDDLVEDDLEDIRIAQAIEDGDIVVGDIVVDDIVGDEPKAQR
jgi:multicomponent Na+:H+ antiporter subunit C